MKLRIRLNIEKFVKNYNDYAIIYDNETITKKTVCRLLDYITPYGEYDGNNYNFATLTADELEKFASFIVDDGWKEISLDTSTEIMFFH